MKTYVRIRIRTRISIEVNRLDPDQDPPWDQCVSETVPRGYSCHYRTERLDWRLIQRKKEEIDIMLRLTWKMASCLFGSNFWPRGFSCTKPCRSKTLKHSKHLQFLSTYHLKQFMDNSFHIHRKRKKTTTMHYIQHFEVLMLYIVHRCCCFLHYKSYPYI